MAWMEKIIVPHGKAQPIVAFADLDKNVIEKAIAKFTTA